MQNTVCWWHSSVSLPMIISQNLVEYHCVEALAQDDNSVRQLWSINFRLECLFTGLLLVQQTVHCSLWTHLHHSVTMMALQLGNTHNYVTSRSNPRSRVSHRDKHFLFDITSGKHTCTNSHRIRRLSRDIGACHSSKLLTRSSNMFKRTKIIALIGN